ncbi:hypothetical protein P3S68_008415 [Capsicum galapagoense]
MGLWAKVGWSKLGFIYPHRTGEKPMTQHIIGAYTPNVNSVTQRVKVLCQLKNGELSLDYDGGNLVSYDPQNGVFRTLSFQGMPDSWTSKSCLNRYNFRRYCRFLDFCYSPTTNKYKVIKVIKCFSHSYRLDVEVLTLGSNSWTFVGKIPYKISPNSQGIMLNGKIHWSTQYGKYNGRHDRLIVSFDSDDDVFGAVPKVDFGVGPRFRFTLSVLGVCLAVFLHLPFKNGGGYEIWVMREYNVKESWVKEFIIGDYIPSPNSIIVNLSSMLKVVCQLNDGKLLLEYRDVMVSYDPENGIFRTLSFQGMPDSFNTIVPSVASIGLISLKFFSKVRSSLAKTLIEKL